MFIRLHPTTATTAWQQRPLPGAGTQASPFDWPSNATVDGTTSTLPITEGEEWSVTTVWAIVRLQASTEYTWSISGMSGMDTQAWLYSGETEVAEAIYDWEYDTWEMTYTPSTTGDYLFKIGAFSMGGSMSVAMTPLPTAQTPWVERSAGVLATTGIDSYGRVVRHRSAADAGLVLTPLSAPNDLTANDSNPEWLVSASSSYNENSSPYMAFNGSDGSDGQNRWMTSGDGSGWISWRNLSTKILVRSYSLNATPEVGWEGRSPSNWTLEGSDDGANWTVLHTVVDGFGGSPSAFQEASFTVPGGNSAYFYHRLNITGTYSGGYLSIGQIRAWSR